MSRKVPEPRKDLSPSEINELIDRLWSVKKKKPGTLVPLKKMEVLRLIKQSQKILKEQPSLLELYPPVNVCGDIHGQYYDLLRLFEHGGLPTNHNYLFLGDYVDRGDQSLEVMVLLLCYKVRFAKNFFLLRGNHESTPICRIYGFWDECKRRFGGQEVFREFCVLFDYLPLAAVIDDKIFCVHAGLSPDLTSTKVIRKMERPIMVPDHGLLCDLLWSDPDHQVHTWSENERGVSFTFGPQIIENFLAKHEFELIIRGHQVVNEGYEFFGESRLLVTLFSAPNYCNVFDNAGAMMVIDSDLVCKLKIIKPLL